MTKELKLELLGSVSITLNGEALVGLRYAKAEALLCYLAVTGRTHSRESLATLLWGGSADKEARASLRGVLSKLARALPQHVVVSRDRVAFNRESPYSLDVEAFLAKLAEADVTALGQGVALYRGDLLEGFRVHDAPEFEEWLVGEQERLRQTMLQALHTLTVHHAELEEHAAGISYVSRLLGLEPWREDAHRQLMLMLARSGQREAALAQYRTCRRILAEGLGLEPSAETLELYGRIEAGEIDVRKPARHNLPLLPTVLLGRNEEPVRIAELLATCRLLTLVGPGGVGKTSLALQAARQALVAFPGGVFFVPLAAINDPELVTSAVAQALDVQETGGQSLLESIKGRLQSEHTLLLLDNFEHLLSAAPMVAELLAYCPKLKVMTTSRAVLDLRGEHELLVPPLAVPDLRHVPDPEALTQYPAVMLFCERAQAVKSDFRLSSENAAAVATVCVRLDGLPLAIELAAAWVKFMSPGVLLVRLSNRLKLLTGGARDLPVRQQTLRHTIAWSYELLEPEMQRLFARLAVFVGGFTMEAAEEVCMSPSPLDLDILQGVTRLANKSLIQREELSSEVRFRMLETIREYALERLEASGEAEQLRRRHATFFRKLAEGAELEMKGAEQVRWFASLEMELDHLRAALSWALESGELETSLRLAGALPWFWFTRGYFSEGRGWLEGALSRSSGVASHLHAKALYGAGMLARRQGDYQAAAVQLEESLELFRLLADKGGMAACLHHLAHVAEAHGDYLQTTARFNESLALAREAGDVWELTLSLNCLSYAVHEHGDDSWAAALLEESLPLCQKLGNKYGTADALRLLGLVALNSGDDRQAAERLEESLALARELGNKQGMALLFPALARAALQAGDLLRAKGLLRQGLVLRNEGGELGLVQCLEGLAEVAYAESHFEGAARFLKAAETLRGAMDRSCLNRYERLVAKTHAALGDERFAAVCAEGETVVLEEAIAAALGVSDR